MTKSKKLNRFLSVLLAAAMVLSSWQFTARAEGAENGESTGVTWEKIANNGNGLLFGEKEAQDIPVESYVENGMLRVSILLDAAATLDKYPAAEIASNNSAKNYRQELMRQQNALADAISREALNGEKLDVVWNITLAANIISANIPYTKLEAVKNL